MSDKIHHPGLLLEKELDKKNLSQRDLSSRIDVSHSLLNNIIKGNRDINVNIAIALESAGFNEASFWLSKQMAFNLYKAKNDKEVIKKTATIEIWKELESIIPLSYLKRQKVGVNSSDDIEKIYQIYDVNNLTALKNKIENFNPTYFRKSSKFVENKNNVLAWSLLAEYKLKDVNVNKFLRKRQGDLLEELNSCFYKKKNVVKESKDILASYGIKFLILDRPSQTPVDGKSFISKNNPAIALSMKYKRLDNFAFTLFHEIGHVFEHLTNPERPEFKKVEFFINSSRTDLVEFEADNFASSNLIEPSLFNDFIVSNESFSDEVILKFSNKNKIHPGIVRGRVCHEYNEYYRKRSAITAMNKLKLD